MKKKTFIWVTFYTADEKLCEYEKYKTWTNWFNPEYRTAY